MVSKRTSYRSTTNIENSYFWSLYHKKTPEMYQCSLDHIVRLSAQNVVKN